MKKQQHYHSVMPKFYQHFSSVILFGQFFGIMPLHGAKQDVKFKWKSLKFFYSIFNSFGAFVMGLFCLLKFALCGLRLDQTGTASFYILNSLGAFQFIVIARNWSNVLKEWSSMELAMRAYPLLENMKRRFMVMTTVVMSLALIEHLLFIANSFTIGRVCGNFTASSSDKIYFEIAFPFIFSIVDYAPWKAFFVELINILATVTWNYTDLFIMLISYSLAARFNQINQKLENERQVQDKFWKEIREDYCKMAHLTEIVDRYLSVLVAISFFNNAFFICVQLFNSLKPRVGVVETIYYFYSFGFLVARTIAVTLYGAWINDESQKPLEILHSVPSQHYCTEITRMVQQINCAPIGISGARFFMITRSFLLKMASTIVTFELMFFQFGGLTTNGSLKFNETECAINKC